MVITDITTIQVETPSAPQSALREGWLFVHVHTDAGLIGLGEASQGGNQIVQAYVEQRLKPDLVGRDPCQIEPIAVESLARASGRGAATAVSGVEQALWDIWGQVVGQPIWALLGGRYRDDIPLYANVNRATFDRSPQGFARSAQYAVAEGFGAVKCAPFDGVDCRYPDRTANLQGIRMGIERVAAMREAIGRDIRLMVDCHRRFDVVTAIQVARDLAPLDLAWLEEPVPSWDLDGLERVREHSQMPIAGAESLIGRIGFWDTIQRRSLDLIMPDVKHTGGILEARKIASMAEARNLSVSPHNPSGPVSTLASVHLCASIPNFLVLEYPWGETPWRGGLLNPPEILHAGAIAVPDRPGLGFTLDEEVVRAHQTDAAS